MSKSVAFVLIVTAVVVGWISGFASARTTRNGAAADLPPPSPANKPARPISPLEHPIPEAAKTRIKELEAQVGNLRKAHEASLRTIQELCDQVQAGKQDGRGAAEPADQVQPPLPLGRMARMNMGIDEIADLLGLDPGRAALLKRAYEDAQSRMRQVESELAKVESKDGGTHIEIPALGDRGKLLQEEWNQSVASLLTPAERERYVKHEMDRSLFPNGFGEQPRNIDLRREGDKTTIEEAIGRPDSPNQTRLVYDLTGDGASELLRNQYGHLIR
ncbi:MAG: hypothetical protein HY716_14980 [Planctomycetes bacterium]|nr:hypothetical protein [Planctomycetota bacterium]